MEIYSFFISKYIKMIKYAISKDVEEFKGKVDGIQETLPGKLVGKFIKKSSAKDVGFVDVSQLPEDKDLQEVELLAAKRAEEQRLIQEEKNYQLTIAKQEKKKRRKEERREKIKNFFRQNVD